MRHRRAQRCLLRAEIALEAGFADDAREALEEARRLGAASEDLARIDAQIAATTVPAPDVVETVVPQRLSWKFVATAILVMALAAALAGVVVLRQPPNLFYSSSPAEPAPQILGIPEPAAPRPSPADAGAVQNMPPASTDGRALGTAGAEPVELATADTAAAAGHVTAPPGGGEPASSEPIVVQRQTVAVPVTQSASFRETTSAPPETGSTATTIATRRSPPSASPTSAPPASAPPASAPPASTPPASASPAPSNLVARRAATTDVPVVVSRAPALERANVDPVPHITEPPPPAAPPVSMPINTTGAAAVPPPTTAAPTAPVRDESVDVRAVLTRYESAYSELDPSQARAVWPGVDERALSRAFNSLASQRVSLGRCDVTLNGATARATCAGSATWTPKVGGGGARTEARRWTFELAKSGDEWKIAKARVR